MICKITDGFSRSCREALLSALSNPTQTSPVSLAPVLQGCGLALAQSWCLCPANVLSCCQYRGGIARYFWEGCCWQGRGGNGRGRGKAAEIARFSSRKGAKNNNIWERGGKASFAVRTEVSWCCWGESVPGFVSPCWRALAAAPSEPKEM